ncbi:hypothetical protein A0H81_03191 [Grifola frondosa]|uniref:Uncharacterized protein n=1 Tax=Grifola frondosa TaxID=5627 RepID=A0A1C7MJ60_GRIFR|nr:hypothetical protein A0H81_03191 [Grifola frondosa]
MGEAAPSGAGNSRRKHATHLCSDNELVANAACLHPFPDEHLGGSLLVIVGGIDEIAPGLVVRVEQFKAAFLVHGAHADRGPLVADAHGAEADGRDVHTGERESWR